MEQFRSYSEHPFECGLRKHFMRIAEVNDAAVLNQRDLFGIPRHGIHVMRRDDDGLSRKRQPLAQVQSLQRVLNVQIGGRFIQQDDLRVRGQTARDANALPLPARKRGDETTAQMSDIAAFDCRVDRIAIRNGRSLESSAPRIPSRRDDLLHREFEIHAKVLRDECNSGGQLRAQS